MELVRPVQSIKELILQEELACKVLVMIPSISMKRDTAKSVAHALDPA